MTQESMRTYCLFCMSGHENKAIDMLKHKGYVPLSPQVVNWKPDKGVVKRAINRLLPGYVFFDAESEPDWQNIRSYPSVLRILQYGDGARAMRGSDAEFVNWLKRYNGLIEISRVVQVGTKIEFVDGPLKDMAGRVVKVNKNRKRVQIALGGDSLMSTIWCSIEYIETNADAKWANRK